MNFLPFLKKRKEERNFFLALLLKPHKITAILFQEEETKLLVLATSEEKIATGIHEISERDLIEAVDRLVSQMEGQLPEGVFLNKTIFGVPYDWVEENKIKKDYLQKLKSLCKELELTPIGFIISIEAVIRFLQKKEGAPVSAVFVQIEDRSMNVFVVKAGRILEVLSREQTELLSRTVETLLKRSFNEVLPSRIILLETEGIQNIEQEFIAHPWTRSLPFLHLPQVMVFQTELENEAIINGVGTQMGVEVSETEDQKETKAHRETGTQDFPREKIEEPEEIGETVHENFGFVENQDILEITGGNKQKSPEESPDTAPAPEQRVNPDRPRHLRFPFQNIIQKASPLKITGKLFGLFSLAIWRKKRLLIVPLLAAVFLIGLTYGYYYLFLKTDIVLFSDKKVIDKNLDIVLSPMSDTNVSESTLKITPVSVDETGSLGQETSGKKETGDPAKGEITIYNKTEQDKTFPQGTVIVGENDLKFMLTQDTQVASTSAFSIQLSSVKASVVAETFGQQYNVPSDTNFTFADFPTSSYFAKNDNAFSGGTQKKIQIVAQSDLDTLLKNLTAKLQNKASADLQGKIEPDSVLLPFIISSTSSQNQFDKNVNDEAQTVNLTAKITFNGAYYKKAEMTVFEQGLAKEEIPSNFYQDAHQSSISINNPVLHEDKSVSGKLSVHAVYLPRLNTENIAKNLRGKSRQKAEKQLRQLTGVTDYKIIETNRIPFLPDYLPFDLHNITVSTKMNG